jgi:hypothetical protein
MDATLSRRGSTGQPSGQAAGGGSDSGGRGSEDGGGIRRSPRRRRRGKRPLQAVRLQDALLDILRRHHDEHPWPLRGGGGERNRSNRS